jgi:hypothetical protein
MLPLYFVEEQVRKEFGALHRPGLRYEEERDFSWGKDVLRFKVSWKGEASPRRHVGVYLDFTKRTVRTQPRIENLDLNDRGMGWIMALVATVPAAPLSQAS